MYPSFIRHQDGLTGRINNDGLRGQGRPEGCRPIPWLRRGPSHSPGVCEGDPSNPNGMTFVACLVRLNGNKKKGTQKSLSKNNAQRANRTLLQETGGGRRVGCKTHMLRTARSSNHLTPAHCSYNRIHCVHVAAVAHMWCTKGKTLVKHP